MRKLEDDIDCAIQFDVRVMISGESGTGKKFVAHLIHQRSHRGSAPFVIANCQDMMESLPDNCTLLIDEVQKIPVPMQLQLLQFIEMTNGSDLRLMTAASTDVFERVRSNQFRSDLFYRLNVIHLIIPALRDRPEDIPTLFHHYLSFCARADVPRLSAAAVQRLVAYSWPGNVRELKAAAETLAAQDLQRHVEPDDLSSEIGW